MATITTLATAAGSGLHPSVQANRWPVHYQEVTIDLAKAAVAKGTDLAASDVIEAITIPANSIVLAAGIEVVEAQTGSSVLTLDLGVTGADADAYVDGFDLVAAVAGDYAAQPAAYQPIVIGNTADTLDVLIATLTTANTGGVIRVFALYGDVKDQKKPGITALKS